MKKILLSLTLLSAMANQQASAQRLIGVATSNWGGTTGLSLNPANIGDSRTRFALDLFSVNFGIDNNLASINLSQALQSTKEIDFNSLFTYKKSKAFNAMIPVADVRLPSLMVSFKKLSFALSTRVRAINQFNNFDQMLFRSITEKQDFGSTDYAITSQDFNWTAHMWGEIKLTAAREVYSSDHHFVKAGVTINRLMGIGFLSLKGKNLDGHYYSANDSIYTTNTDLTFASSIIDEGGELKNGLGDVFGQFFGKKGGGGWGADVGVVYEYRTDETNSDDKSSNKYKVRGSVAITDIGSIKYNSLQAVVTANGYLSANDFASNIKNFSSFESYASSRGYHLDTGRVENKVSMPTTLILGADYYVGSHFYVNAVMIANMANRMNFGNSYYNQFTITPRWDTRFASVAVPLTYSSLTKGLKAGVGLRAGGVFVGSDDLLAVISGSYGMNVYSGLFIPINKKRTKGDKETKE